MDGKKNELVPRRTKTAKANQTMSESFQAIREKLDKVITTEPNEPELETKSEPINDTPSDHAPWTEQSSEDNDFEYEKEKQSDSEYETTESESEEETVIQTHNKSNDKLITQDIRADKNWQEERRGRDLATCGYCNKPGHLAIKCRHKTKLSQKRARRTRREDHDDLSMVPTRMREGAVPSPPGVVHE